MSLATIGEVRARGGVEDSDSDASLGVALDAVTSAIEAYCNTYFGRRISRVIPGEASTKFVVPGHSLSSGDTVRLSGMADSAMDGDHEVTVIAGDEPAFSVSTVSASSRPDGLIRKHFTKIVSSTGGERIWINPRPVAEIVEINLTSTPGVFDETMDAADYMLELDGDGVSISGAIYRLDQEWPYRLTRTLNKRRATMHGAAQIKFIPGLRSIPGDIVNAAIQLATTIVTSDGSSPASSESVDYYSYSALAADAMKGLPETTLAAMNRWRRTV